MDEQLRANQHLWNAWAPHHVQSELYDVEGFKAGDCRLDDVQIEEVGDVTGRSLLHLQCHFGLDTLSWARRGARVTGVDFSDEAIAAARSLAAELDLDARFVCCNLYDVPEHLDERFDIVYTSCGVLCWLPDLTRWAEVIAGCLAPGGFFYLYEFHPFVDVFAWTQTLSIGYSYFPGSEQVEEVDGSYAGAPVGGVTHEWSHSLSEIVGALLSAGLRLEFLHEFPDGPWCSRPFMTEVAAGRWGYADVPGGLPVMLSIKACRQG